MGSTGSFISRVTSEGVRRVSILLLLFLFGGWYEKALMIVVGRQR